MKTRGASQVVDGDSTTRRYLGVLGASEATDLFWMTLGDKTRAPELSFIRNAPFPVVQAKLHELNERGAGVFVCLGRVNGSEPLKRNIQSINVLVLDLDKAPLPEGFEPFGEPHLIVCTSPGRWHCYWRVAHIPLGAFPILQRKLARHFRGDVSVSRTEQIVRVPGFLHHKSTAFRSHIVHDGIDAPVYDLLQLVETCSHLDVEDSAVGQQSIPWLRDQVSGQIIDEGFLAHAVWTEALTLTSRDPLKVAQRAWARFENEVDSLSLAGKTSFAHVESMSQRALKALISGQAERIHW